MPESLTHKWIPKVYQRENNLFVEEYYSSTDVKIFIEDEEQTEVSYITYTLQEQLKPLYGYSSRTFDDVAIGNRIVTGILKIPIKNPDKQSSIEDIYEYKETLTEQNIDYNTSQNEKLSNVDWIKGSYGGYQTDNSEKDDNNKTHEKEIEIEDYAYSEKLSLLNYNYDTNTSFNKSFIKQINEFQIKNNIPQSDKLNNYAKKLIDEQLKNSKCKKVTLSKDMNIYYGPNYTYDIAFIVDKECSAYISYKYLNGWAKIILDNNKQGFVNITGLEEGV